MLKELLGPTLPVGDPEVRAIAVTTADGQVSVAGTSQSLGSNLDAELLQELRWWSDVVLVGSRTVKAENYGGVQVPEWVRSVRKSRGQAEVPPIAVISRSLDFDMSSRFFTDTEVPPLVLTPTDRQVPGLNTVHVPDEGYIDALGRLGLHRVSVEGGPGIYSRAFRRNEVDLLHLTIAPSLALSSHHPLMFADSKHTPLSLSLEYSHVDTEGCVFLRYRVRN